MGRAIIILYSRSVPSGVKSATIKLTPVTFSGQKMIQLTELLTKHPDKIRRIEKDEAGYWLFLQPGWIHPTHPPFDVIHSDLVSEVILKFKLVRQGAVH